MIAPAEIIVPKLSKELYLCSLRPALKDLLLRRIKPLKEEKEEKDSDEFIIKAENDSFNIINSNNYKKDEEKENEESNAKIILINDEWPNISKFNVDKYFKILNKSRNYSLNYEFEFGSIVLYGEVVTSTQTLLDKNVKLTQKLPNGFVTLAAQQVEGRGRGKNTWISPPGCLLFSFVMRHSLNNKAAPVVFIQYLLSLAVVEAVRTEPSYKDIPLRLKWPNDIYVEKFNDSSNSPELVKIGGVLLNSHVFENEFLLIAGCGEELLASILVKFELFYKEFCENGRGFEPFFDIYYKRWLHR
ncbi:6288_t:CDS:2 [Diversispora eburnea]|uniref:6288_t:CDS:1 n=1 Tax=Diversispora eburnea TaxID=1213867 RepID=A0A9N8V3H0_9GLOM|nr:6288_t:CDS:2 [Diversispora eburnea]